MKNLHVKLHLNFKEMRWRARSEPGKPCKDPRPSWWRRLLRFRNIVNSMNIVIVRTCSISFSKQEDAGSDQSESCHC
jgi:hypothetical protein